ncbi:MAG TPA: glycosyltransferase family 2 protein [Polyangiaceae bacterium]
MNEALIAAVVPAYDAEATVGAVVRGLLAEAPFAPPRGAVIVVDDGSLDSTSQVARECGAIVLRHASNRGKGAALRTGFEHALTLGAEACVTVDADGQHFPREAALLAAHPAPLRALVLGVRDLSRDGAPRANRFSNGISNFFLSRFTGLGLEDTQCGLRRYPLRETLRLGASANGYAYEAECVLRAARGGLPIVQTPIRVYYPEEHLRITHFHSVRDPARIVFHVVRTVLTTRRLHPRNPP